MTRVVKLSRSAPREMRIRQMLTGQAREHAIAVSPEGRVIGFTRGTRSGVEVPPRALVNTSAYDYYHSHPDGGSFSGKDWRLLGYERARSMHAVGTTQDYQLRPPANFDRAKWSPNALEAAWQNIADKMWNDPRTKDLSTDDFMHQASLALAKQTGVTYKVADKDVPFDKVAPSSGSSVDDEPRDDKGRWTK